MGITPDGDDLQFGRGTEVGVPLPSITSPHGKQPRTSTARKDTTRMQWQGNGEWRAEIATEAVEFSSVEGQREMQYSIRSEE